MTPATYREAVGLTIEKAAKKARISVDYLKRVERRGYPPLVLSERLSRLYQMPENEWFTLENFDATMKAKAKAESAKAAKDAAKAAAKAAKATSSATPKGRSTQARDYHHALGPVSTTSGNAASAARGR